LQAAQDTFAYELNRPKVSEALGTQPEIMGRLIRNGKFESRNSEAAELKEVLSQFQRDIRDHRTMLGRFLEQDYYGGSKIEFGFFFSQPVDYGWPGSIRVCIVVGRRAQAIFTSDDTPLGKCRSNRSLVARKAHSFHFDTKVAVDFRLMYVCMPKEEVD